MLILTNNGLHIYNYLNFMNLLKILKSDIIKDIQEINSNPNPLLYPPNAKLTHNSISPGFCYFLKSIMNIQIKYNLDVHRSPKMKTKYILHHYQKTIIDKLQKKYVDVCNNKLPFYLTIIAPCGFGKTILGIDLIKHFRVKTFIVVPTFILGNNFYTKISELTNAQCFVSKNGARVFLEKEYENNHDILIIPNKHLENLQFCQYLHKNYSLGIFDECHINNIHNDVAITHFLNNFTFPNLIFLTATERINNKFSMGLTLKVTDFIKREEYQSFKIFFKFIEYNNTIPNFENNTQFTIYKKNIQNKNKAMRCRQLCFAEDFNRHKLVVKNVLLDYKSENKSKILMVTLLDKEIFIYLDLLEKHNVNVLPIISGKKYYAKKYISHQSSFFNNNSDKIKIDYYNKDKYTKFIKNKQKFIIIGNFDYIGYGVDFPDINALHFTNLSISKTINQQSVGRVSRNNEFSEHFIRYYIGTPTRYINVSSYKTKITEYLEEIGCQQE